MRPWADRERATLRRLWTDGATREALLAALPGRSWCAVLAQALRCELLDQVPAGLVSVSRAARTCGFPRRQFVSICRELGVRVRLHPRPTHAQRRRLRGGWRYVDLRCVLRRLPAWLAAQGETATEASRRLGVSRATLARRARRASLFEPQGRGRPIRLPCAVWDRLVTHQEAA